MSRYILFLLVLLIAAEYLASCCLITNCPRGGKRSSKLGIGENNIKSCISCGPGKTGQCFGPNICCGPFGCHMGTQETLKCQREGMFHEREPCIAGTGFCRRNTGRCAAEGLCCTQESCFTDRSCSSEDKARLSIADLVPLDLYNIMAYQTEYSGEK